MCFHQLVSLISYCIINSYPLQSVSFIITLGVHHLLTFGIHRDQLATWPSKLFMFVCWNLSRLFVVCAFLFFYFFFGLVFWDITRHTCVLNAGKGNLCKTNYSLFSPKFLSMADEDPVDPRIDIEERCKSKCVRFLLEYQTCAKRIAGDETGEKHCTGQYFDYLSCIDKCVAPKLFTKLK